MDDTTPAIRRSRVEPGELTDAEAEVVEIRVHLNRYGRIAPTDARCLLDHVDTLTAERDALQATVAKLYATIEGWAEDNNADVTLVPDQAAARAERWAKAVERIGTLEGERVALRAALRCPHCVSARYYGASLGCQEHFPSPVDGGTT